jgi:hypothetical protein
MCLIGHSHRLYFDLSECFIYNCVIRKYCMRIWYFKIEILKTKNKMNPIIQMC